MSKQWPPFPCYVDNRWRHAHHGDDTGHACPDCGEPMFIEITRERRMAKCYACQRTVRLIDLSALEDLAVRRYEYDQVTEGAV